MKHIRYSKEVISDAVAKSKSVANVLRLLGISPSSGGMNAHIKKRIKFFEIDSSHFTGQGWNKGRKSRQKLSWQERLVLARRDIKEDSTKLREAMIESGIEYQCDSCGCFPVWEGKPLTLETDHKNGNNIDNRKENLRFLCPNCHSQTSNFRYKNATHIKSPDDGMADDSALKSEATLVA
jgi:predicted RNA-binding Zn-ribbon protein involved in translation (DUF1610 family)